MPELPEVECTLRGIKPHALNQIISKVIVRNSSLRWPVAKTFPPTAKNQTIDAINRRGKYLIFTTKTGNIIIHLGMSGSLQVVSKEQELKKHDHIDIALTNGKILRFNDPRRFGCVVWTQKEPLQHKLLNHLGIEPLSTAFNHKYFLAKAKNRKMPIKTFIMNNSIVVGIGNIYVGEALFLAGINPETHAGDITHKQFELLITHIKAVLKKAIKYNGTTIRDYISSDGNKGNYKEQLLVYGKANEPCPHCKTKIKQIKQTGRSTFYCPECQR